MIFISVWPEVDPGTAYVNCISVYFFSFYDNDVDIQT